MYTIRSSIKMTIELVGMDIVRSIIRMNNKETSSGSSSGFKSKKNINFPDLKDKLLILPVNYYSYR